MAIRLNEGRTITGQVMDWAGSSAPTGWLLCDGSAVSQTTYAALYAVIGVTYGDPGGGNFNLPDFRGRVTMGVNDGTLPNGQNGSYTSRARAATPGSEAPGTGSDGAHSHGMASHTHYMQNHTHTISSDGNHYHNDVAGSDFFNGGGALGATQTTGAHTHGGATGTPSSGNTAGPSTSNTDGVGNHSHSSSAVQPSLVVNKIIKT